MKHPIDEVADSAKKTVDDARDRLNEQRHRNEAGVERDRRNDAGEFMTPPEKAGSVAREGKERLLAEIDEAKRKLRDSH